MIHRHLLASLLALTACATLTNDPEVPIEITLEGGGRARCALHSKRHSSVVDLPATVRVRRSDDALQYVCLGPDRRSLQGRIPSSIGPKFAASTLLDLGITDAMTDMHREYPATFVIPTGRGG